MSNAQIVMLVGCGIIAFGLIPFASADYLVSLGIIALGIVVFINGALMHDRSGPPTA